MQGRYQAVARVLARVFVLNLGVAVAKIAFGYFSGAVSVLSDGFHSLIDASSNVVGLIGIRAASPMPTIRTVTASTRPSPRARSSALPRW
jgi:divalent metal cation (Fe/Co/Zn/Cd) transporter